MMSPLGSLLRQREYVMLFPSGSVQRPKTVMRRGGEEDERSDIRARCSSSSVTIHRAVVLLESRLKTGVLLNCLVDSDSNSGLCCEQRRPLGLRPRWTRQLKRIYLVSWTTILSITPDVDEAVAAYGLHAFKQVIRMTIT